MATIHMLYSITLFIPFFHVTSSMGNPATGQWTTNLLPSMAIRPDEGKARISGGP